MLHDQLLRALRRDLGALRAAGQQQPSPVVAPVFRLVFLARSNASRSWVSLTSYCACSHFTSLRPRRGPALTSTTPPAVRPTAAERVRSVSCRPSAAVLAAGVSGSRVFAHATTRTGSVLLVVPTAGELAVAVRTAAEGDLPALVMVSDHAPVTLRDPVRAQLWLSGWPTPVPDDDARGAALEFAEVLPAGALLDVGVGVGASLLRLDLAEVVLGEGGGTTEIEPEDYTRPRPTGSSPSRSRPCGTMTPTAPEELALLRSRIRHSG